MRQLQLILVMPIVSIILLSFTAKEQNTHTLTVEVENLRNSKGIVQFALYNKDNSIPDEDYKKYYRLEKAKIVNGKSEITFKSLPQGKYAVNILHDENNNGKIDKGLLLPKEGIGFSNYQSVGLRNRPNFYKASFDLTTDKTISVRIIYM